MSKKAIAKLFDREFKGRYKLESGGAVRSIGNRKDFERKIGEEYLRFATTHEDVTLKEFTDGLVEHLGFDEVTPAEITGCLDIDVAVDQFIEDKNIKIRPDGKQLSMGEFVDLTPQDLKEHFREWCFRKNQFLGKEDVHYSHCDLYSVFYGRLQGMEVKMWGDIQKRIKHDPREGRKLPQTIAAIFDAIHVDNSDRERFNADRLMFAHWAWTLKRRICRMDKNPSLPLMLVFRGRQGCGKSSFVENYLGSVFYDRVVSTDLSVLHDCREFQKWTSNVIVNFDELSFKGIKTGERGRTTDLLKQLLTSSHTQERMYHTQNQQTFNIRATFCCTSNPPLAERISDHTGMRRYWEIICQPPEDTPQFDWDALEDIDWVGFWQGVDESKPDGYITTGNKYYPHIEEVQNEYCVQPSLRRWFEDLYEPYYEEGMYAMTATGVNKDARYKELGVTTASVLALYGEYTEEMRELGNYALSQAHFIGCMEKMGIRRIPRSRTHAKTLVFVYKKIQ